MNTYRELYNDYLDELATLPPGYTFSLLLERGDSTSYEVGFSDFLDDPSRFRCGECDRELTGDETHAADMDDVVLCAKCAA